MTTPKKSNTDWSNTWWGKILLLQLTLLVGWAVLQAVGVFRDIGAIPGIRKNVRHLMVKDSLRDRKEDYDSLRIVLRREEMQLKDRRERKSDEMDAEEYGRWLDSLYQSNKGYLPKRPIRR